VETSITFLVAAVGSVDSSSLNNKLVNFV